MEKVTITVTLGLRDFRTTFTLDKHIPEYIIADKAYALALSFAETQYIARYGHPIEMHTFAEMLKELDYNYTVEDIDE